MNQQPKRAQRLQHLSRVRRAGEKEKLQNRIFGAAAAVFLERGYEGFSMRQIAERIGYSATTIYGYYDSKDDLLYAMVQEGFRRFGDQLTKAAARAKKPRDRLKAVCAAYVDFGLKNPVYYQLMFMQRADFLFENRDEQGPMIDSFGILEHLVQEAMEAGMMKRRDPRVTSTVIWAVGHGITSLAIADPRRFSRRQLRQTMETALEMILHGLAAR
jgi:AcrR family transcriptional regulator